MQYTSFFNLEQYHHPHRRHDPPGSEDADVNNDGKVDQNDKYIMAKRRLYKQYQAAQKSKKATDFSTPKLENNMIRLSGLVNLQAIKEESHEEPAPTVAVDKKSQVEMKLKKLKEMQMTPDQEKKVDELLVQMEELTAGQKKLDVDGDGKIEADDLAKLRAGKKDEIIAEDDTEEMENDPMMEDHEVSMAQNLINDIIKNATELKEKVGMQERNLPAWIQDHISQAQNFISQANTNFHESEETNKADTSIDKDLEAMNEAAPEGWEKTIKAMKKHKEIDNPWALANWMKKKGYQPQKENVEIDENIDEIGLLKKAAYVAKAGKDIWKRSYSMDKSKADSEKKVMSKAGPTSKLHGKEMPSSAKKRAASAASAKKDAEKIAKRFKGIDTALGKKVKNPETGKEILATTAAKDPSHPAHSAAKSALGKSK